ncbi:MAG: polysaccharide biosynthesis/export family protein [Bacteroidetes bacterium]|nr:polysaccharide biosynthesis/export family protein [Bacteroidota bacterium]
MFKIPKGENFQYDSIPMKPTEDYVIGPGDRFTFFFSTNNGERIVSGMSGVNGTEGQTFNRNNQQFIQDYLVRRDGTAELPVIGIINVRGFTTIQLEDTLTELLSKNYIDPFVQIRLSNQRIIIFPGRGQAQVVNLNNVNTTLLEVIALAGGLSEDARANSIKLIRKNKNKREIYKIDLSTIQGLKQAEMIVQSNDYIYVDVKPRIASSVLTEVTPWVSILTSALLLFTLTRQ